VPNQIGYR